jgi:hypothetical protein
MRDIAIQAGCGIIEVRDDNVFITVCINKDLLLSEILDYSQSSGDVYKDLGSKKPERTNTDDDYDNMMKKKKTKAAKKNAADKPKAKKKTKVVKPLAKRRDIRKGFFD